MSPSQPGYLHSKAAVFSLTLWAELRLKEILAVRKLHLDKRLALRSLLIIKGVLSTHCARALCTNPEKAKRFSAMDENWGNYFNLHVC